jgi:WD40 repeat protein
VHISDSATGREIRTVEGAHTDFTNSIAFSPGGTLLASVSNRATDAVMLWDAKTWKALGILSGYDRPFLAAAFGPGGGLRAAAGEGRTIELWDVAGKSVHTWDGESQYLDTARFSNDGRTLVTVGRDDAVKAWNADTGQATPLGARTGNSDSLALSADGQLVATESADDLKKVELWDVATGRALHTLQHTANVGALAFSGDGRLLAVGAEGPGVALWDTATGRAIRTVGAEINEYSALALSADGRLLASSAGGEIALWDSSNGSKLRTLAGHDDDVRAMAFSPDVRLLASVSSDRTVKLWDIASGRELHSMSAGNDLNFVRFSPDGRLLAAMEWTGTLLLFDVAKGRELATVVRLVDRDWAAVDPEGRFDASPAGMDMMHWTVGTETISLNQLKDRYYEPGLVGKLLGSNREPLRNVAGFTDVKMFPEIEAVNAPADGRTLELQLKNRGGGIGRVQVFVNGKEVAADARGPTVNANAADATLTVDLSGAHWKPGEDNDVRIVSWNGEGYLASRGVTLAWKAPGTPETAPPELYAIVSGISEYASADFRLHFAAKDAEDFGRALEVAGTRLFGKERVHLTLLTSGDGAGKPTKENLAKAFAAARRSKPGDILVVYLAGHGVAVRDTYAYPTEEARTLELTDPAIRQQTAVTSEELVTWIKAIPALHQVMILDTCAAGAAQRSLVEKRDLPSDQIRAIDRLKDRTGFYVLMGSAADAASYEASQFGQGLLTYSLLQGMRGAALRDNKYVDVSRLFEYAADEVPQLARNIGGVQRPLIAAPQAGASFDIGELETADKAAIPLAVVKPIILRPVLINPAEGVDNLGLMQALRTKLRDESYVGARGNGDAPAVFVDEEEFPGAVRPTGTYTVEAGQVKVRLVLSRNGQKIGEAQVAGTDGDRETLVNRMVDAILKGAR